MINFHRIARVAILSATICVTVGASGVLATMTWQLPADARTVTEEAVAHSTSPSLIMTAANAYIDSQTARMALQTASPSAIDTNLTPAKAKAERSIAQLQQTCLKRVSKRRNAPLVRVPCSPLQSGSMQDRTIAAAEPTQLR